MNFLRRLALQEEKLDDSSRLDVVQIARVPYLLPSLFPSWSGLGLISTPVFITVFQFSNITGCPLQKKMDIILSDNYRIQLFFFRVTTRGVQCR